MFWRCGIGFEIQYICNLEFVLENGLSILAKCWRTLLSTSSRHITFQAGNIPPSVGRLRPLVQTSTPSTIPDPIFPLSSLSEFLAENLVRPECPFLLWLLPAAGQISRPRPQTAVAGAYKHFCLLLVYEELSGQCCNCCAQLELVMYWIQDRNP
jgi:hypothetical protein